MTDVWATNVGAAPAPYVAGWVMCDKDAGRAEELAREYIVGYWRSVVQHYEMNSNHFATTKGYEYYGKMAEKIQQYGTDTVIDYFMNLQVWGTPDQVYAAIGRVAAWWNPAHTYSGDAGKLSLSLTAGGCLCEALPEGGVQHGVMAAAAIIFFAFYGFDAISTAAEEAKNPSRDLTIGIVGSMLACAAIYMLVATAALGAMPFDVFAKSPEPLAFILRETGYPTVAVLIAAARAHARQRSAQRRRPARRACLGARVARRTRHYAHALLPMDHTLLRL